MTTEQAIAELIDTGRATVEAQDALYLAGFISFDPFRNAWVPTQSGKDAVKAARKSRSAK